MAYLEEQVREQAGKDEWRNNGQQVRKRLLAPSWQLSPAHKGQCLQGSVNMKVYVTKVLGMRAFIMSDKKSVNPRTKPIYEVATANNENTCATSALKPRLQ